jgi:hypothetical protein
MIAYFKFYIDEGSNFFIPLLFSAMTINAQNVTYAYDNAGNRTDRVITMNSSSSLSPGAPQAMTALTDLIADRAIVIYPNPTKGILTVEIPDYQSTIPVGFLLTNLSGQAIFSGKSETGSQTIDLSRQPAGIYLLRLSIGEESTVWKIIKE